MNKMYFEIVVVDSADETPTYEVRRQAEKLHKAEAIADRINDGLVNTSKIAFARRIKKS